MMKSFTHGAIQSSPIKMRASTHDRTHSAPPKITNTRSKLLTQSQLTVLIVILPLGTRDAIVLIVIPLLTLLFPQRLLLLFC